MEKRTKESREEDRKGRMQRKGGRERMRMKGCRKGERLRQGGTEKEKGTKDGRKERTQIKG